MKTLTLSAFVFAVLALFAGCGSDGEGDEKADGGNQSGAECSGHGSLHGDHCHCEEGYESDETECVKISELGICGEEHEHEHEGEDEGEDHDHEGHDHAESCRCKDSSKPCDCEEGTEAADYNGLYYCKADHHHEG